MFVAFTPHAEAVGLAQCVCQISDPKAPLYCPTVTCMDVTSGFSTNGICVAPGKCQGLGTSGPNGFGTDILKQVLGSLFQKLMQGSQNGNSGASTPSGASGQSCSSYTQTSDQSLAASNPCYYYVPPVSAGLGGTDSTGLGTSNNISDLLNQALGGTGTTNTNTNTDTNTNTNTNTNTSVSDTLNQIISGTQTNTNTNATTTASTTPSQIFSTTQATPSFLTPGLSGDIKTLTSGGTILAGNVDTGGNSTVAGFYGSDTFGGQPQGVIANLCQGRPWASNFLSYVIPPGFFDSLCALRGYTVGVTKPVQQSTVTVTQTPAKPITATTTTPVVSTVEPKVDIWASPATVSLGTRTSIFWTSQGVTNCTETSPDGNFSQSSLSGGASTAPITGATVFTISCLAPDGSHITDNVTVNLAI